MNRTLTALFAALEALLVVSIGVAIPLVPLTVLWGAQYGFAPDWLIFWRAAADTWLVGHGADLTVVLDAATAKASGLGGAAAPFTVTIAALGFALLTVLLACRAGRRISETSHRTMARTVAIVVFAVAATGVAFAAQHPLAHASVLQGAILPTLYFSAGIGLGSIERRHPGASRPGGIAGWVSDWPAELRAILAASIRGGAATAAAVVGIAAAALAVLLAVNYAQIITLYEGLHSGPLGGAVLTLGELAFLPNLVIWTASWIVGPGFAIGAGSSVNQLATNLGPIPAIPVFGALPHGQLTFALAGLLVPVGAAFLAAAILSGPLAAATATLPNGTAWERLRRPLGTALGIGLCGGVILGLFAWLSSGSIGPGRLLVAGPDPWAVGGWATVEIVVGALLGMAASSRRPVARVARADAAGGPAR